MSSLQGAISSLVYSSGALATAASIGYVFVKPAKSKSTSLSSSLSSSSSSKNKKKIYNNSLNNDNNFPVKKRFKLFRLKTSKHLRHHCNSNDYTHDNHDVDLYDKMIAEPENFIVNYFQTPPSTPPTPATDITHYRHNHHRTPLIAHPDQLTDDDVSSCSDVTSFYLSDRSKSCSVTTFATLSNTNVNQINNINHPLISDDNNSNSNSNNYNNLKSVSMTNVATFNSHNLADTLLEEDEEENWNDNSSIEEDKDIHLNNNNPNNCDGGDDILIDSSSSTSYLGSPLSSKKTNRTSLPPPEQTCSSIPLKNHHRCKSLPPIPLSELSPSFYRQPTPSESWDNDFVLDDLELNVPNSVKDTQISLKMDIYTIKDFISQIEELKVLYDDKLTLSCTIKSKMKRRRWSNGFLSNSVKKYNTLENLFRDHWEEAAVIIDLSEIAQDRQPMFGGGKRVEVDIENIPSKRHLQVLKRIIEKEMANNNSHNNNTDYYGDNDDDGDDDDDDDDHKENHYKKPKLMFNNHLKRNSLLSLSSSSSSSTKSTRDKKKKEKNHKDFRISVEVMPSLVEHLRKLQESLTEHLNELKIIAKQ